MIVELSLCAQNESKFEARAKKMRETWGDNTIVWFSRGWQMSVHGHDAEVMESICNLPVQFDNNEKLLYGQFPVNDEYRYRAPLVKAGYKIVWLNE